MPIVIGTVGHGIDGYHARRRAIIVTVEEQQIHAEALREKTLKLTPPEISVAPRGEL